MLTGSTAINGTGNSLDNVLTGNTGVNILTGSSGNDTLDGGSAADTLIGGTGNDTYVVDNTGDVITESSGEGTDLIQSSVTYTAAANVENLTLTGSAAINGTGNGLDNILSGNTGANTLDGSSGNDTLDGGNGLDTLIGGTGADVFLFHVGTAFSNVDVVSDFNTGQGDKLDLRDILTGYDPNNDVVTNWVRISDSGSNSIVEVDKDGAGSTYGWTQIATLAGVTDLTDEAALVASGNLLVH